MQDNGICMLNDIFIIFLIIIIIIIKQVQGDCSFSVCVGVGIGREVHTTICSPTQQKRSSCPPAHIPANCPLVQLPVWLATWLHPYVENCLGTCAVHLWQWRPWGAHWQEYCVWL